MIVKFFNLNTWKCTFSDRVIEYIQKNNFDIIHLQEVNGGMANANGEDGFRKYTHALSLTGERAVWLQQKGNPSTYAANVTFYKPPLVSVQSRVLWLKDFFEMEDASKTPWSNPPRNALVLDILLEGKKITFINTHLTWGPTSQDEPYKLEQAAKLISFMKELTNPFVLSGDFNVDGRSQIVKDLNGLATNVTLDHGVTNTLNTRIHRAKNLFPPGIAVDFIYVSRELHTKSFLLLDKEDLSDHLGQIVEIEFTG